ncbi:hypothetical protein LTR20_004172 [Exophiala xenobiotica]|nr:hypothetical protein LTS06_011954 [Exophiala xenobiotica]KAK5364233.1 hypothetical protein LTS13_008847 [Exophiala xenobiotica]KAK5465754.1 hypothetical protein LTR20_004172 [Exophiala xenobiotica]KAK5480455.1 hypothetical protein LTR83_010305 [Exophiala xenobiotica]KAK5524365.1 hypothetical protein LTR07_002775 [Exophiala xenobiotica]
MSVMTEESSCTIDTECPQYAARYDNMPTFIFDPKAFATLNTKDLLGGGVTTKAVLNALLQRMQLRFTMASEIHAGDEVIRPGHLVPIYWISAVELEPDMFEKAKYKDIWTKWIKYLNHARPGASDAVQPEANTKGLRDMYVHRLLSLLLVDMRFFEFLMRSKYSSAQQAQDLTEATMTVYLNHARPGASDAAQPEANTKGLRDIYVHRLLSLLLVDMRFFEFLIQSKYSSAQQAQELTKATNDCGFSTFFFLTRPTPNLPNYLDRISAAKYLLGESPTLRYACRHIYNAMWGSAEKGGKLTIYVNWPLSQWHTICFLSLLGIDYYTTWPGTSSAEKDRIYAKFNDKEDPVRILIVNLRSSAVGLNLQNCCAKILVWDKQGSTYTFPQEKTLVRETTWTASEVAAGGVTYRAYIVKLLHKCNRDTNAFALLVIYDAKGTKDTINVIFAYAYEELATADLANLTAIHTYHHSDTCLAGCGDEWDHSYQEEFHFCLEVDRNIDAPRKEDGDDSEPEDDDGIEVLKAKHDAIDAKIKATELQAKVNDMEKKKCPGTPMAVKYLLDALVLRNQPLTEETIYDAHRILLQHTEPDHEAGVPDD